jgi:hypothetical protein
MKFDILMTPDLSSESIHFLHDIILKTFSEEQSSAILDSINNVMLTFEICPDWGFIKIIAVNGQSVNE